MQTPSTPSRAPGSLDSRFSQSTSRDFDTPYKFKGTSASASSHHLGDRITRSSVEDDAKLQGVEEGVDPELFIEQLLTRRFSGDTPGSTTASQSSSHAVVASSSDIGLEQGNTYLERVKEVMKPSFGQQSPLGKALIDYRNAGDCEGDGYPHLVNLFNYILATIRKPNLKPQLDQLIGPESEENRIQVIRYDKHSTQYEWGGSTGLRPDILIVLENSIRDFANEQVKLQNELREKKSPSLAPLGEYDPSLTVVTNRNSIHVNLRAALCPVELKWRRKSVASKATSTDTGAEAETSISGKRKATPGSVKNGKKSKRLKSTSTHNPQMGTYGSAFLSRCLGITHMIGLIVDYAEVFIYWCDRQSIIVSSAINIFEDFETFAALVTALSRLTLREWGIMEQLNPDPKGHISLQLGSFPLQTTFRSSRGMVQIKTNETPIFHRRSLLGRGTLVVRGELVSENTAKSVIVKFSHPETSRLPEHHFIEEGHRDAKLKLFLPKLFAASIKPMEGFSTTAIRKCLGLPLKEDGARAPYLLVMEPLVPMTTLTDATQFFKAMSNCIGLHHEMWNLGFEHGDISLNNLMCRQTKNPEDFAGVLIDWDLATLRGTDDEVTGGGMTRTGTIPWMSLEFLLPGGPLPKFRRYRHDMESFGWCLVYQCLDHAGNHDYLRNWHEVESTYSTRKVLLTDFRQYEPRKGFDNLYKISMRLIAMHVSQIAHLPHLTPGHGPLLHSTSGYASSPLSGSQNFWERSGVSGELETLDAALPPEKQELKPEEVWELWSDALLLAWKAPQ